MGSTSQRDIVMTDQSPLLHLLLFKDAIVGLLGWKNTTENLSRQFYTNGISSPGTVGLPPPPPNFLIKKRKRYTEQEVSKSESWVISADKMNKKKQVSRMKTDLKERSCLPWESC